MTHLLMLFIAECTHGNNLQCTDLLMRRPNHTQINPYVRYLIISILKGEGSQGSFDETSEEEKIEEQLDNDNINIEVIIVGDKTNYPVRQNHTIPI